MKVSRIAAAATIGAKVALADSVQGFDILNYQPNVDFGGAYASGARFVIIKATEGTSYIDPTFSDHYIAATDAGFVRGYHFAHPGETTGAAEADYFIANGGNWSGDGITLPGMLDLEGEGSGTCWGLSQSDMVAWIQDFSDRYQSQTTRYPMLYTNPSWWRECTGDSGAFVDTNPLVLAAWGSSPGTPPGGWPFATVWQNADTYAYGGDSDVFSGSLDRLTHLATGEP